MNYRRKLLIAFGAGTVAAPTLSFAQQAARIFRVGVIGRPDQRDAFRKGLVEHGWIEGKSVVVEYRAIGETAERIADSARELSGLGVDSIVPAGNLAISTLKHATPGIPVVMAGAADAVGSGFVANL